MEIKVKIGEIDYGTIAAKVMPLLRKKGEAMDGAVGKLLSAMAHLPTALIYELFDAISEAEKNEIVALLVEENQERIVGIANEQLCGNGVNISVESLSVTPDLDIRLVIGSIDYGGLVVKILPLVRDKLAGATGSAAQLLSKLSGATPIQIKGMLAFLPQSIKDEAVVYLLNQNRERIISLFSAAAQKHGVGFTISDLMVEA